MLADERVFDYRVKNMYIYICSCDGRSTMFNFGSFASISICLCAFCSVQCVHTFAVVVVIVVIVVLPLVSLVHGARRRRHGHVVCFFPGVLVHSLNAHSMKQKIDTHTHQRARLKSIIYSVRFGGKPLFKLAEIDVCWRCTRGARGIHVRAILDRWYDGWTWWKCVP